jgi:peptide chain release factor subunit 1
MIKREDIRELAEFESPQGCALSFYFQPGTPQDRSHREEAILAKDLVRHALHEAEKHGKNGCARTDLERILEFAERLHGNHARAKAVFACGAKNFWKEFDLPPRLTKTALFLNQCFHLKPLAVILDQSPKACIALVDRAKARVFDLWMDEIREREQFEDALPRRGRSDGFIGYDAGHADRHLEHGAMHHFKKVADRLKDLQETGNCERLLIGCRDETWPEFEPHLHPYVKERLVGHFTVDAATATPDQVKASAERRLAEFQAIRKQGLIREVLGEAHRNARGALGPRRVLRSLETGEVQTLLLGRNFAAPGVACVHCGHMDIHVTGNCAVCGQPARQLSDIADALIGLAIRRGIEVVYIGEDAEFEKIGNIAALLRFRADQNTSMKLAV